MSGLTSPVFNVQLIQPDMRIALAFNYGTQITEASIVIGTVLVKEREKWLILKNCKSLPPASHPLTTHYRSSDHASGGFGLVADINFILDPDRFNSAEGLHKELCRLWRIDPELSHYADSFNLKDHFDLDSKDLIFRNQPKRPYSIDHSR